MKTFVNVDRIQNVLERQIHVMQGHVDVVTMMNAPKSNFVGLVNAKVRHC